MKNPLAKDITIYSMIKFTVPTILMMVVMALYTMVDGIFVARLVSTDALSAVNIVYPILNITIGIGIMFATGASALVGKEMGEGNNKKARAHFSMVVYVGLVVTFICAILLFGFIDPLIKALGATERLYDYCYIYGLILILFIPIEFLQIMFQYFFVTAGKPRISLITTIAGGVANIVLDYVFIVPLDMGVAGAALATGIGFSIPALFGLFYFSFKRKGTLFLTKAKFEGKIVGRVCLNGSSEMVVNLAISVTTILYNLMMLRYIGEDGVAAITIVLYAEFLLNAIFLGYVSGVAPLFSYNYGEKNIPKLKRLFKFSWIFVVTTSIVTVLATRVLAEPIVTLFAQEGTYVYNLAIGGFHIFALGFIFMGSNIFASGLFTSLSNGKISALISFMRTFFLLSLMIIALPTIFGIGTIWLAVPVAESISAIIVIICIVKYRKKYEYC